VSSAADYSDRHTRALAQIGRAGAPVTFTSRSATSSPTTGTVSMDTEDVSGNAVRVQGDAWRYKALELVEAEAPTLFFAPDTYGDLPSLNATVSWNSTTYTVRDVEPIGPSGLAIAARVIVSR
jgi:hypothetical protein